MLVRVRHGAHENKYCPISTKASTSASYTEDINSSFILGSSFWLWPGYFYILGVMVAYAAPTRLVSVRIVQDVHSFGESSILFSCAKINII